MLTSRIARALPVALAVSVLAAGCGGGAPAANAEGDAADAAATASAAPAPMTVASMTLEPEAYWVAPVVDGDATRVSVGGCADGAPCPGFVVLTGDSAGEGAEDAVLDDGVACPGDEAGIPIDATLTETAQVTVAHAEARLLVFDVTCAAQDGSESVVQQRQWVASGAGGTTVIVDRWGLDGLDRALAEATWSGAA
ncbi:hypothetical protein [Demequina sp. NBRC 110057]|uniref:hypothetical protein n=1 Tax=Demequina sp. NBRC 110057 TaxID=1570346 RepID=UPI000A068B1D|nr:hypothetical protein [Demequina sp. NBRC 110057]